MLTEGEENGNMWIAGILFSQLRNQYTMNRYHWCTNAIELSGRALGFGRATGALTT